MEWVFFSIQGAVATVISYFLIFVIVRTLIKVKPKN